MARGGVCVRALYTCERMLRNEITQRGLRGVVSNRGTRIRAMRRADVERRTLSFSGPREKVTFYLVCVEIVGSGPFR